MALRYKEHQRQVQIYDYLVYICGVEVSSYTRSIEITRTNRSGPGSATIVFANPFDQWVMTRLNLQGSFRQSKDRYSELPKMQIYNKKKNLSKTFTAKNQTDPRAMGASTPATGDASDNEQQQQGTQQEETPQEKLNRTKNDFQQRYSFGPGTCIFSKLDPVKIFIRNPYTESNNEWIPAFTGTIDSKPLVTNFITGESSVTVNAFDIRAAMQGMRVSINPYKDDLLAGGNPSSSSETVASEENLVVFNSETNLFFNDGFFKVGEPSRLSNIFAGKSFVDSVSMIITGKTGWVPVSENKELNPVVDGPGIGDFQPGSIYHYSNKNAGVVPGSKDYKSKRTNPIQDLTAWDLLCLFGEDKTFWSLNKCIKVGEGSFYDGPYHPFTGKLHWLLPSESLPMASMFTETVNGVGDIMGSPDWTDRYSLLVQMCNQVDYEFTVTGNGDIVFEFPMYDISPDNFGRVSDRGSHGNIYVTEKHVVSENISDEGGEVLAAIEAVSISSRIDQSQVDRFTNETAIQTKTPDMRVVVFNNVLASKYGAKVQNMSFVGVRSPEALKRLALIEFQKRLADANKLSLEMVFRPFLQPNRPFLYSERNRTRLGKINTVSFSMTVMQEPSMSLALSCVRLPLLQGNEVVFQHISGAPGMPLSYNEIFEIPTNFQSNNGTVVLTQDTPKGEN